MTPPDGSAPSADVKRYLANWQDEIDSVALYGALADLEDEPRLADVYRRLAAAEERHAGFWEQKLRAAGARVPARRPGWRTRLLITVARRFGSQLVLPTLNDLERRDSHGYDSQPESRATAMPAEERSHARLLQSLAGGPGVEGAALGRLEGRHRAASGNALRAAVLGANDGLLSNFSLVMGVAGAQVSADTVLVTGLAGLLAGAGSMAMGEWVSVQSARELAGHQLEIEARELEEIPDEEREELALIYEAKGLASDQARELAARQIADRTTALDTLAREELGIDPDELGGSAAVAAGTSFVLFAVGAILPVLPFFFLSGATAVIVSAALSVLGLFAIGALITVFTGRGVLMSGGRQVLIGAAAATLTYLVGLAIGGAVGV
ncbi:MAG TPA: VIT1/CCC1 family protein [Solirubrobacter sp.]|nr:VIT1/CCC1 family protein [Solirubrobacter sp.]